jgi:hypothetical protein
LSSRSDSWQAFRHTHVRDPSRRGLAAWKQAEKERVRQTEKRVEGGSGERDGQRWTEMDRKESVRA